MTAPADHQPEPTRDQQGQQSDTAAVARLLLTSGSVALLAAAIYALLRRRGRKLSRQAVTLAVSLASARTKHLPRMRGSSDEVRAQRQSEAFYRAAYIVAAAQRIEAARVQAADSAASTGDQAADLAARAQAADSAGRAAAMRERSYEQAHERARGRRLDAARVVAQSANLYGDLLGWYSHRDDRVTPECRMADGSNFRASVPPVIGFPGTLHGGTCRCEPGPPHPGGPSTDEATGMALGGRMRA